MDFLTQAPLGPDAAAVADQRHADHQLGVGGGATGRSVEGLQVLMDVDQIDEAIDRAQQVIGRHMALQAEAVEQRLLPDLPLAYHGPALHQQEN
jgi:hypothetical protein